MTIKTLQAMANKERAAGKKKGIKSIQWSEKFKHAVIEFHYESGMSKSKLTKLLELNSASFYEWNKKYRGNEQEGFSFGDTVRMDVATQAMAVKRHLENKEAKADLASEYHVSPATINTWVNKYEHDYEHRINTGSGYPYPVKEHKKVFGTANIAEVLKFKEEQAGDLAKFLQNQHMGLKKSTVDDLKKAKKKTDEQIKVLKEIKEEQ